MDDQRPPSRLARVVAEFGVIVLGVLVALWIDAGWAWLQERGDERELIEDLRSDFQFNLSEIERIRTLRQEVVATSYRVTQEGPHSIPTDSVGHAIARLAQVWSLNPRTGALEGAIQSGRLGVLRSGDLRNALAGWGGHFEDAEEEIEWVLPSIQEQHQLARVLRQRLGLPTPADTTHQRTILVAFADDDEISGRIMNKTGYLEVSLRGLDDLRTETLRVLDLLSAGSGGT